LQNYLNLFFTSILQAFSSIKCQNAAIARQAIAVIKQSLSTEQI